MSHYNQKLTASVIGAMTNLVPDSGTSPVTPNGADAINLVTNTPGATGTSTVTAGTNPTTTVGTANTVTITQNNQTFVSGSTAAGGTLDIFTYTQQDNSGVTIFAQITGIEDTTALEGFGGTAVCNVRKGTAGGTIEYQLVNADGNDDDIDAIFVLSGDDIILRITGSMSVIYNWNALVTYIQVLA